MWSAITGAALLFLTDNAVIWLAAGNNWLLPTGAVTAIFGAPLLIALLPRLKTRHRRPEAPMRTDLARHHLRLRLALAIVLSLAVVALAFFIGRSGTGAFTLLRPDLFAAIGGLRAPRSA